jgi:F0F1-type ATP synthase assembly protein I
MGFEIAVPVMLFTFLGYKADGWLGTEPWLVVVGALLGMALAFYTLFKRALGWGKGSGREDR